MPTFSTEGIIVKRKNFGEADKLLTVITPYKGKITILAKGVRKITSRRGGNVELLNKVKLHFFQGQGMPVLSEAVSLETFPKIKSDLIFSTYASHIAEIAERFLPENQPNPQAYSLLLIALSLLEKNPRQIFIRAYEVKLLTVLGFWGGLEGSEGKEGLEGLEGLGGLEKILEKLQKESWEEIGNLEINKNQALELERILRYYIEKVLEGKLRSLEIIQKLKIK